MPSEPSQERAVEQMISFEDWMQAVGAELGIGTGWLKERAPEGVWRAWWMSGATPHEAWQEFTATW